MSATTGHGPQDTKKATVNGLAVVGFGALIIGGILLAIYASKYVPDVLSRLTSAVYLSADEEQNTADEIFGSEDEEVDAPQSKEPETSTVSPSREDDEPQVADETGYAPQTPRVADETGYTPIRYLPPVPVPLYGDPDLVLTRVRGGYFRGSTFVEDEDVPDNRDAAVKFRVQNGGTNIASNWRVLVEVAGEDDATASGALLRPDGFQDFTLRISDSRRSTLRIEITVDPSDRLDEENERNNDRSLTLDLH
ncbi:MAG: CARDB domain-containing protein [Minisyncoccia bacterium]